MIDKEFVASNCGECPLNGNPKVIGETNAQTLEEVDILFLAEAPAATEIEEDQPLVGKAGKIFRSAFNLSRLNREKFLITNIVLCSNLKDGKTFNPPEEAVKKCAVYWQQLVELCKPRLIFIMGGMAKDIFGIKGPITEERGKFFKYKDIDLFLTIHPSYVLRNGGYGSEKWKIYSEDFFTAKRFLTGVDDLEVVSTPKKNDADLLYALQNEKYSMVPEFQSHHLELPNNIKYNTKLMKLPAWCYNRDISLLDIQKNYEDRELYFIFKTTSGEKIVYSKDDNEYYFYKYPGPVESNPMLMDMDKVKLETRHPSKIEKNSSEYSIYEGDVRSELKYAIDYNIIRKKLGIEDPPVDLKIMFADIEVFLDGDQEFPDPMLAPKPINSISFKISDADTNVWLADINGKMDKSEIKPEDVNLKYKVFNSEIELLEAFANKLAEESPDVLTGWNFDFDIFTIVGRMEKLGIDVNRLSPLNKTTINREREYVEILGVVVLDMLHQYKEFNQNKEETYKLSYIAQKNLGKDKVAYEGLLDDQYTGNINKFIDYSATDTELLYELENALNHIKMKRELVRICSSTWSIGKSTIGLLDPLSISYAREMGTVCRNKIPRERVKIEGAFVGQPVGGLYKYIVDFDYTSLYPSIIISFNIGPNTFLAQISDKIAYNIIYKKYDDIPSQITITMNPLIEPLETRTMSKDELLRWVHDNKLIVNISGAIYKPHDMEMSFFTKILKKLMDSRKEYKQKMFETKDTDKVLSSQYNNIQWAYKITANSLYGVLANPWFRLTSYQMGESVTAAGREINKFAQYHMGHYMKSGKKDVDLNFLEDYDKGEIPYIVYSDTDSMFVNINAWLIDTGEINPE